MLGYLANSRIDGNAMRGMSGASAVNMAAGDLNQQANLRAFAVMAGVGASRQRQQQNQANRPLTASASIGGNAYNGGSGLASINQASGSSNAQVNVVAGVLAQQGIRETTDGALSSAVSASAGGQHPDETAAARRRLTQCRGRTIGNARIPGRDATQSSRRLGQPHEQPAVALGSHALAVSATHQTSEDTMNSTTKKTLLALTIAAMFSTASAYASERGGRDDSHKNSTSGVTFEKKIKLTT